MCKVLCPGARRRGYRVQAAFIDRNGPIPFFSTDAFSEACSNIVIFEETFSTSVHGKRLLLHVSCASARLQMASSRDDFLVQSPTSTEKPAGLLLSHANTLSTDVELPSKSDKPPLLKHMYLLKPLFFQRPCSDTDQLNI